MASVFQRLNQVVVSMRCGHSMIEFLTYASEESGHRRHRVSINISPNQIRELLSDEPSYSHQSDYMVQPIDRDRPTPYRTEYLNDPFSRDSVETIDDLEPAPPEKQSFAKFISQKHGD